MGKRQPLSLAEKERIYQDRLAGRSLTALATELGCSVHCVHKWWQRGRKQGLTGLRAVRRGRGSVGLLSQFEPQVATTALTLKRRHTGWGAQRVLIELANDPALQGVRLPHRSRLADFFKAQCPECLAGHTPRPQPAVRPNRATAVHEQWQLDSQEGICLQDGTIATICNIRDPVGAAMIASQAVTVQTKRHWRKLDWTEIRTVLRQAFFEWQTLPDSVQTDNELALAGGPNDPFPGKLTLWLTGLGIRHQFIRPGCPKDQPQIERNHRTLDGLALDETALANLSQLQQALDRERRLYNQQFPCHASDCAGQPPLTAHPELGQSRRYYQPDLELALFDPQRVWHYLATFTFKRTVSTSAQVSLGRQMYCLGQKLVRTRNLKMVLARFDPASQEWVFFTENEEELLHCSPKGLDVATLTGLDPVTIQPVQPVQLTLPFLVA